jgi:predicted permease
MNRPLPSLRYALRQLQLNPTFALVVIVSLALGIGANTAVFQLLDAVRLRSLPIHDPKELTEIKIVGGNHGFGVTNGQYAQLTRPIWKEIKQHHEPFSGVFAWSTQGQTIGRGSQSHPVQALEVSGEFFPVLGILPWRGRLFVPEDENSSCTISQVVVSYPYWQNQMGGRELGNKDTLLIEGHLAQVIGVTPPGFFGLAVGQSFDVAFPFCHEKEGHGEIFDISIMGRLRPGWSIERASAQMGALSPGIFEITAPAGYSSQAIQRFKQYRLGVYPASAGVSQLRADYDSSLWLLLIITGLVLLIACANLANLMLARASAREREFAVRSALGASRIHLLGQSLSESCLLAVIGTTLGIGLAQVLNRVLVWALSTGNNTVILSTETDLRVLFFAASVALLTCIVFGLAPALRSMSAHPLGAIQSIRNMTGSRDRFSMQRLMVIMQISVSLVLLVGALLFIRSFNRLLTIDTGIRERGITLAFFGFAESHLPPASFEEFKRELLEEVRSVPGVQSAATTTNVPLLGGSWTHGIHIGTTEGWSKFAWVSPDYFKTMGIPLEMGRGFNQNDTATSPRVAVVNQAFIRQWVGRSNPIGQTLRTGEEPGYPSTVYQIVGVIPDTKYNDIRGVTPPMTFAPSSQFPAEGPWTAMMIYSETSLEAAIKRKIAQNHPEIVTDFSDFQQDIRDGLIREKLLALLSGFFGILAALLAMVGLYGVIAYIVARRRQEIGIRVALGANRGQVVAMVMRESLRLLLIGLGVGTVLALVAGRGVESLLFGLKPYDPLVLFGSIGLLTVIAALASFLPAQRAARIDPMVALRYE